MATQTDISNLALAALGDEATVVSLDPPEGSAQADHCAQWLPAARDAVLELHDWKFATRRVNGAPLPPPTASWRYAYAKPAGCLRVRAVQARDVDSDTQTSGIQTAQPFDIETLDDGTEIILTDAPEAVIRYTAKITDVTKFPPLATQALVRMLASYLAGPVLKGDAGRSESRAQLQLAQAWIIKAQASDANQVSREPHGPAAHITARGGAPVGWAR